MKNKKIIATILMLTLILTQLLMLSMNVIANQGLGNGNITVHKLQYNTDLSSSQTIKNTGKAISLPEFVKAYDKSKYGDVGFTIYKVKPSGYSKDATGKMTLTKSTTELLANTSTYLTKVGSEKTVNSAGQAVFNVPQEETSGKRDGILYLIAETTSPTSLVVKKAEPMVIQLPLYDEDGLNSNINLYPKNKVQELTFTLTKYGEEKVLEGAIFDLYKGIPGSGTLLKSNLKTTGNGQIKATGLTVGSYYFVEKESEKVSSITNAGLNRKPFVLGKDAQNDANNILKFNIPKEGIASNKLNATYINYRKPKVNKKITNAPSAGDLANFMVKVAIPKDVANPNSSTVGGTQATSPTVNKYNKYVYTDTYTGFVGNAEKVVLKIDNTNLVKERDYKVVQKNGSFEINFIVNGDFSDTVKQNAGKEIIITYGLKLPNVIASDLQIKNKADLAFGKSSETGKTPVVPAPPSEEDPGAEPNPEDPGAEPNPEEPEPEPDPHSPDNPDNPGNSEITIKLYDLTLIAKEASILGTGKVLPEAQFKLRNKVTGKYLSTTSSTKWVDEGAAEVFRTNSQGKIVINSLSPAEYEFVSVKAPTGYQNLAEKNVLVKVVDSAVTHEVTFKPLQGLPVTGSDVIILTALTGLVLFTFGVIVKRRKEENK